MTVAITDHPKLKDDEVKGLKEYVLDQAKTTKNRHVTLCHEELAGLLTGDLAWDKAVAGSEEREILEKRRNNRIRFLMARPLSRSGIQATYGTMGYTFIVDSVISIDVSAEEEMALYKKGKKSDTYTDYKTPFYPPNIFPILCENLKHGTNCKIVGPRGTGKSRTIQEAGAFLGIEQVRIPIGTITDPAELIGSKELVEEGGVTITKYVMGTLTRCVKEGKMAILEEIDMAAPQIVSALNLVLERESDIEIPTETGPVVIKRHANYRVCATANTWGYGEGGMDYAGAGFENRATQDRFGAKFGMDYDINIEKRIMRNHVPESVVQMLYNDIANDENYPIGVVIAIREAISQGSIPEDLSPRSLEEFARSYHINGWHRGWIYNIINGFNPAYRANVAAIVTKTCGNEFAPSENDYDKDSENYIPTMESEILCAGEKYKGIVAVEEMGAATS